MPAKIIQTDQNFKNKHSDARAKHKQSDQYHQNKI
jgi:hypothetical protein